MVDAVFFICKFDFYIGGSSVLLDRAMSSNKIGRNTMHSLEKIHLASSYIEMYGAQGFTDATIATDQATAVVLLVAYLRRFVGATGAFPTRPPVEEEVNKELARVLPSVFHDIQK
jgi:hypothetical protein